ncbi:MAG TPA: creatininase family protein [Fimbriimonadaceae bacterium]|nr:creatininase family protein [Fimbriimonadaceae bacterium]
MKLAHATWPDVEALPRDVVVLIPTGSLEQHGPHLPLFTDSLLVTAVAEAVEARIPGQVLLTPTLWLGASGHHLAFAGTLSASFPGYQSNLEDVVESLRRHGFTKFFVVNGHGGNTEPNGVALRTLKERHPELVIGHAGYFEFAADTAARVMEGPLKHIRHACEAEASLALHVFPELVRTDKLRDDGLIPEPSAKGMIFTFDEMTEQGSLGYATLATAEKGRQIFEAAVDGVTAQIEALASGIVLKGLPPS